MPTSLRLADKALKTKKSIRPPAANPAQTKPESSAVRSREADFREVIRSRRGELSLTQAEVASRIKTSSSYVGQLESGARSPSKQTVTRLAKALRLDEGELFLLASVHREASIPAQPGPAEVSFATWNQLRKDKYLRRIYSVSTAEVKLLSHAPNLHCGFARLASSRDLIFMLNTIRDAVTK